MRRELDVKYEVQHLIGIESGRQIINPGNYREYFKL
jgi:hypothetical protein